MLVITGMMMKVPASLVFGKMSSRPEITSNPPMIFVKPESHKAQTRLM